MVGICSIPVYTNDRKMVRDIRNQYSLHSFTYILVIVSEDIVN